MLYKPNFCCNCGEKIERAEWNLLTSRRFCEPCAAEKSRHDNLPRIAVLSGALGIVFGLGSFWGGLTPGESSGGHQQVGLVSSPETTAKPKSEDAASRQQQSALAGPGAPAPAVAAPLTTDEPREEARFYCGALTKKGTPCSRKVKAKGLRCFQHEGRPEAPPTE